MKLHNYGEAKGRKKIGYPEHMGRGKERDLPPPCFPLNVILSSLWFVLALPDNYTEIIVIILLVIPVFYTSLLYLG